MPEYFFHVSLELFPNREHTVQNPVTPVNLSHAFKALNPFRHPHQAQNARDPKFDVYRRSLAPKSYSTSTALFDRTIAEQVLPSSTSDHRLDEIRVQCVDMEQQNQSERQSDGNTSVKDIGKGLGTSFSGSHTKGQYTALEDGSAGEEWGIVHLYRDTSETPGLYRDNVSHLLGEEFRYARDGIPVSKGVPIPPLPPARDEDCTMLCILAVPSYLSPADFLAFVGEKTRDQVSHFRMIRTSKQNRYMVLLKFRNGKRAREWQADWNGKVFNSMEPETVHVVFLKSVEIMPAARRPEEKEDSKNGTSAGTLTFPSIVGDPFAGSPVPPSAKPMAPRTSSLVELPTCPVCLERMDETTGLLTILCQHVFHCTCLQKWSGGGCPVCRYTHDDFSTRNLSGYKQTTKFKKKKIDGFDEDYEMFDEPLECETCHTDTNLWQCLICGKVGCGRYEGKHAYKHFEETGHTFAMDLDSKRVWDYNGDVYVHRIIQEAATPGEKLVEIPGRRREPTALEETREDTEQAKIENVALEYTHLLTSQLESQRVYFEEIVERAVDKATQASRAAERAAEECDTARIQLQKLSVDRDELLTSKIPNLELEISRVEKRAIKFEEMARSVNLRYLEEKSLVSSLMERIAYLEHTKVEALTKKIQELEEDNATKDLLMEGLRDEHRDAMMQISAQEKLREMVANGELEPEDLIGATIEAGPIPIVRKGKKTINEKSVPNATSAIGQSDAKGGEEDDLTKELRLQLGLGNGLVQKGQAWDDEVATKMFDEFKTQMLEKGLFVETKPEVTAEASLIVDDNSTSTSTPTSTSKKKKKGKGKK